MDQANGGIDGMSPGSIMDESGFEFNVGCISSDCVRQGSTTDRGFLFIMTDETSWVVHQMNPDRMGSFVTHSQHLPQLQFQSKRSSVQGADQQALYSVWGGDLPATEILDDL